MCRRIFRFYSLFVNFIIDRVGILGLEVRWVFLLRYEVEVRVGFRYGIWNMDII